MDPHPSPQLAALVAQAEALTRNGRPQDAAGLWEKVVALDPGHATALNQLGALALAQGDLDLAQSRLERALAADPGLAMAHASLSRLHARRGDHPQALASIDAAIRIDPTAWGPQAEKARLLEAAGQLRAAGLHWGNAMTFLPQALRQQPQLQSLIEHAQAAVTRNRGELASHLEDGIGPMLQGLRKPVNDLSRGALVDDIVFTIALTAIQAQAIAEQK